MNEFKKYHPAVNLIYFVFVIGYCVFIMHPVCVVISLVCSFCYSVVLNGRKTIKRNLSYMIPMIVIMALLNPVFNHQGVTILWYFPNGNPLTAESIVYGISASAMIVSVICWFSCYNLIMTSDKFIYLFGKIIPSLSLIFSMTLRFVPRFSAQLKVVSGSQHCIGRDASKGGIIKRAKCGLSIISVMTTWALENAVETADSMKSRGYGLKGRTAFSIYTFDKRDMKALAVILVLSLYVLMGIVSGSMYFNFYPNLKISDISMFDVSVYMIYTVLCIYPVIIEVREVRKWKHIESKT